MKRSGALVVFALIIGFAGGYLIAAAAQNNDTPKAEDHSRAEDGDKDGAHDAHTSHEMFDVLPSEAPTVSLSVTEDAKSGWNVQIESTNFEFTPENVNKENVVGEGHAHLYVDGKKVARLYGPSFHYDEKFDYTKTFKVTLNANDHSEYAVDGKVISAETTATHHAHN